MSSLDVLMGFPGSAVNSSSYLRAEKGSGANSVTNEQQ